VEYIHETITALLFAVIIIQHVRINKLEEKVSQEDDIK
jgi:hypothetical protein